MTTTHRAFIVLARRLLSVRKDTDYAATLQLVSADAQLRSSGAWSLVFAILIASVGLNVNSTAVVIGAMLISPLMGPIVGTGLALGTSDVPLLRQSLRSLLIATGIALVSSTIYFAITPLSEAQSELLARTRPTIYDVLIALFGGAAGIMAASRRNNRSLVAPGVSIATALMPPLCTAGFGLAHLDWRFFLGAMHLYLINALFICLATFGFTRLLGFRRVSDPEPEQRKRIRTIILFLTLSMLVPSAWTAFTVVRETSFKGAARRFLEAELASSERSQLNLVMTYRSRDSSTIDVTLIGERIGPASLDSIRARLPAYRLAGTRLIVRQPLGNQPTVEQIAELVKQGVSRDADLRKAQPAPLDPRVAQLTAELGEARRIDSLTAHLARELGALYPNFVSISLTRDLAPSDSLTAPADSVPLMAVATWQRLPERTEQERVRRFIMLRLVRDQVQVTHVVRRRR
jgi:uncharacterized hydrophobic protein (TIGR00271 family)